MNAKSQTSPLAMDDAIYLFPKNPVSYNMNTIQENRFRAPSGKDFCRSMRFAQMLSGLTQKDLVQHSTGKLGLGEQQCIPLKITQSDHEVDIVLLSPHPSLFEFSLISPDGQVFKARELDKGIGLVYSEKQHAACFRMDTRTFSEASGVHTVGAWLVSLCFDDSRLNAPLTQRNQRRLLRFLNMKQFKAEFGLMVQARSELDLSTYVRQECNGEASRIDLGIVTQNVSELADCDIQVSAEWCSPCGTLKRVLLGDDDGRHFHVLVNTQEAGVHSFRITVEYWREDRLVAMRERLVGTSVELQSSLNGHSLDLITGNVHGAGISMVDFMEVIEQQGLEELIEVLSCSLTDWDYKRETLNHLRQIASGDPRFQRGVMAG